MTQPEAIQDRRTQPGSMAAVVARLELLEESQKRIEAQLASIFKMLHEVLEMATKVHAGNVDLNSRVATLEDKVDIIERALKRRARKEKAA